MHSARLTGLLCALTRPVRAAGDGAQLLAGDAAVADGVIHDLLSCLLILPGDEISWAYNYYKCLLDSTTLLDILLHKFVPH